ncbi:hypothetical protein [Duganella sp. HH101]|uniref:hypothetical protein n=1 Tax=Duganella sp. HH101 TaxID=1781066 RepID=UPI000874A46F|nr:hypothetical protein [Duganella sp. HH101]OEZ99043.1 hypothetical protein DUGA2_53910 [Duganella sp. HH101]
MSLTERLAALAALAPLTQRRLRVLLSPQQLLCVVRHGQRLVEGSAQQIAVAGAGAGGHWQASIDALRALLQQPAITAARLPLDISLSGRWSQLALAPWSDALLSEPSAARFLQTQLAALYGDNARGWSVVGDDAPYGHTRLVCGVDSTLLQALTDAAAERGHACRVIEPLLATALRTMETQRQHGWRRARKDGKDADAPSGALALVEPGRITMAALRDNRIVAIQSQPASEAWRLELTQAWQRWTLRAPELAGIATVAVTDLSAPPALAPAAHAALHLVPEALPSRFVLNPNPFGERATVAGQVAQHPMAAAAPEVAA